MTCAARDGICSYCFGLLGDGKRANIGTNIGLRSAQSMAEPMTQMALDSKHAAKLTAAKGKLSGLQGFTQMTQVPKNFLNKAIVAKKSGVVTAVNEAPQGGFLVYVGTTEHYVEPGFKVFVKAGDIVEAGDVLSEGIPSPTEVVAFKGLGAGRKHYVNAVHDVYKNSGIDLDKRHLENLAKQTLNYVKVVKSKPEYDIYAGEIHNYNMVRDLIRKNSTEVPLSEAKGKFLGDEYLHYTAGTHITKSVIDELKKAKINKIKVSEDAGIMRPIMQSSTVTPLMNPDLLAKMGFRNLKRSFLEGVQEGAKSDIHGTSPWPGYIYGKEFGEGPKGHY